MVTEFGNWVRTRREEQGMTQTECAARSGMKLQQWNRMEKQVTRPEYETAVAVAEGLRAPAEEVLAAANYVIMKPLDPNMQLARKLESHLMKLRPDRRQAAERMLISQAQQLSEALAI